MTELLVGKETTITGVSYHIASVNDSEKPERLQRDEPQLYALFSEYYAQDPAKRVSA